MFHFLLFVFILYVGPRSAFLSCINLFIYLIVYMFVCTLATFFEIKIKKIKNNSALLNIPASKALSFFNQRHDKKKATKDTTNH